jgi:hypothetical protein
MHNTKWTVFITVGETYEGFNYEHACMGNWLVVLEYVFAFLCEASVMIALQS